MQRLFMILAFVAFASAITSTEVLKEEFEAFKLQHNKNYEDKQTKHYRFKIYLENKMKVDRHNKLYAMGKKSYKLALNEYADLLHSEFKGIMNGLNNTLRKQLRLQDPRFRGSTFIAPKNVNLPDSIDWRDQGAVTEVKNQGQCGSCWSFSSTGALEGQHFRKTGQLVSLSEQNLLDCSGQYGNQGCGGGFPEASFRYVSDNGGIDTESSYPYEGQQDSCQYNSQASGATDSGFVDVTQDDEVALKTAVGTVGPVSVLIDASQQSFQFYSGGVYYDPNCSSQNLDHAVLAVGYGTDPNGSDYWLVKNSWGTTWGDKGYIKIARNQNNQCGIASGASYPLV